MIDGTVSGRSGGRETTGLDDSGSTLLDIGDESVLNPGIVVDDRASGLSSDQSVVNIGVLSSRVVTPDGDLLDGGDIGSGLGNELRKSTVVVKTSHGGEVLTGNIGGVRGGDQTVGVGGVSDDNNLDRLLGGSVKSLTLTGEDGTVVLHEVGTLHAGSTRLGSNKEGIVSILKTLMEVRGHLDSLEKGESAVIELHGNSLERVESMGKLNKLKDDGLVGSEHSTRGNAEEGSVTDLSSGSSDGNLHGGLLGRERAGQRLGSSGDAGRETRERHFF